MNLSNCSALNTQVRAIHHITSIIILKGFVNHYLSVSPSYVKEA